MAKTKNKPAATEAADADPPRMTAPKIKRVQVGCPACGASGHVDGDTVAGEFCGECKGSGKITVAEAGAKICPRCEGEGEFKQLPCRPCASTGKIAGNEKARASAEAADAAVAQKAKEELDAKLAEAFENGRQQGFKEAADAAAKAKE